jgi:hypothetical protein
MKSYINNRFFALALSLTAVGGLVSCADEFLEKAPKGELTSENFFKDANQAEQAVNAIYAKF